MSSIASKITGSSKVNQYNHERTECGRRYLQCTLILRFYKEFTNLRGKG